MTVTDGGLVPKQSLMQVAAALEQVCNEIDAMDGVITDEMIRRFDDAKLALSAKTDRWILYIDALKHMTTSLKDRKERAAKALKSVEALQTRLKEYVKFVIEQNPDVPFRGEEGSLYLHGNPESVRYSFDFEDKTFYRCVHSEVLAMEPSIVPYVKAGTVWIIDGDKVKADLKAGMKLSFASLERGKHVRVKG